MQDGTHQGSESADTVDPSNHQATSTRELVRFLPNAQTEARRRTGFIRRIFWLDERISDIAHAGLSPQESGWQELELAQQVRRARLRLSDLSASNVAVGLLRRTEALELTRATMKRHGIPCSSAYLTEQDWKSAESIEEIRGLRSQLNESQRISLESSLAEAGDSYLLRLNAADRRHATRTLARLTEHLTASFRRDREAIEWLRFQRWLRVVPATLTLAGLGWLAANRLHEYRHKDNLAFHRPVRASSTVDAEYLDTARLVDGNTRNVGFHTRPEDRFPWAVIDLGSLQRFSRVEVYNRADCCKERQVPMVLEVSQDGVNFERIAERRALFDQWTVSGLHASGRFLRMRLEGTGMFHLAEVAVYE